jgi:hypothetical protein
MAAVVITRDFELYLPSLKVGRYMYPSATPKEPRMTQFVCHAQAKCMAGCYSETLKEMHLLLANQTKRRNLDVDKSGGRAS